MVVTRDRLAARRRLARRRANRRRLLYGLFGVAMTVAAIWVAGYYGWKAKSARDEARSVDAFVAEMQSAARGLDPGRTSFGGVLEVRPINGRAVVTAKGVPQSICVGAGWKLVREGWLAVNGITPQRVTASRLAELCSRDPGGARVEWSPRE